MKIFLSWSEEKSHEVAELFYDWISCVLQAVDPWISSDDIDKGSIWFNELSDQLSKISTGIVFITKDNKNNPWLLFEAGALARNIIEKNRVHTFLIDLENTDITGPLAQLNHTLPKKEDVFKLVRTINCKLGENLLKDNVLERSFNTHWPQFETDFEKILKKYNKTTPKDTKSERTDNDILLELLSSIRHMEKKISNLESQYVSGKNLFITPTTWETATYNPSKSAIPSGFTLNGNLSGDSPGVSLTRTVLQEDSSSSDAYMSFIKK